MCQAELTEAYSNRFKALNRVVLFIQVLGQEVKGEGRVQCWPLRNGQYIQRKMFVRDNSYLKEGDADTLNFIKIGWWELKKYYLLLGIKEIGVKILSHSGPL